jgi:hypothetical protein
MYNFKANMCSNCMKLQEKKFENIKVIHSSLHNESKTKHKISTRNQVPPPSYTS